MSDKKIECLCMDCLRLICISIDDNVHEEKCICGGELCNCGPCEETIELLKKGELDYKKLGLISPITSWNEKDGYK